MRTIDEIMRTAPVIPVLVIEDAENARELAEALVGGGLRVLEVTLRTPAALDAIRRMNLVPGAIVGAGTVLNEAQFDEACAAGAEFIVSPGLTEPLARVATRTGVPFRPGVATATEIMHGHDLGLDHFQRLRPDQPGEWLAHPSVLCVGGSWIVPKGAGMAEVNALARQAATLAR